MLGVATVPISMQGRLAESVLLSYRTPADSVRDLVPRGLELVTRESGGRQWAFWNIVVCRVESLRPAGAPQRLGVSYCHVAYRLRVVARLENGRDRPGLYFTRSDASRLLVGWAGNRASDFKFHAARISLRSEEESLELKVRSRDKLGNAELSVDLRTAPSLLPGSIFTSLDEAREQLAYEPTGLSPTPSGRRVRLAEVLRDRGAWRETPVHVNSARWEYLDRLGQHHIALELATRVSPIDYRWRLGRSEPTLAGEPTS